MCVNECAHGGHQQCLCGWGEGDSGHPQKKAPEGRLPSPLRCSGRRDPRQAAHLWGGGLGCVPWWAQPGEDRMGPGQPLATPAHLRGAPGSSLRLRAFVSKRTGLVASSPMPFDPQGLRGRPCLTAPCSSVSPAAAPLWAVGGFLLRQGWRRVRCHPPLCHAGALRQGRHGGGSLCDQAG